MTLLQSLLGFTLLAAVVTVTPGLDTVLVLRQALRSGRRPGFAAAAAICLGALVWSYLRAAVSGGGAHTDFASGSVDAPREAFVRA